MHVCVHVYTYVHTHVHKHIKCCIVLWVPFLIFYLVYMHVSTCVSQHSCGGQKVTCGSQFSLTVWVSRIKPRSSGLVAVAFSC